MLLNSLLRLLRHTYRGVGGGASLAAPSEPVRFTEKLPSCSRIAALLGCSVQSRTLLLASGHLVIVTTYPTDDYSFYLRIYFCNHIEIYKLVIYMKMKIHGQEFDMCYFNRKS